MNANPTEARRIVEHQLHKHESHLDAALRWFNQQLGGRDVAQLRRLELRFPARTAKPIDKAAAQSLITELCKNKGVVEIEISVRHHELPLDNDLGHVTVRAIYLAQEANTDQPPAKGWLARLKDLILGSDDVDTEASGGAVDMPLQLAVGKLLEGLDTAATAFAKTQTKQAVGSVVVTVFAPELHRMLAPKMPPADTQNATVWIAREIQTRGLQPVPDLALHYHFQGPLSDSTNIPSNDDMTVSLLHPGDAAEPAPSTAPKPDDQGAPRPQQYEGTAMPLPDPVNLAAAPTVQLRLLGTWQGGALVPLGTPFDCNLGPVPALFSRTTLQLQGFTQRPDGAFARAASNSTPLNFSADGQGGIKLHAAHRPGTELAMYFFADGLAPCAGEHPLTGPLRLVVNGPALLENGLFPLVIEVSPVG